MEMKPVHCCLLLVVVCILFLSVKLLEGDQNKNFDEKCSKRLGNLFNGEQICAKESCKQSRNKDNDSCLDCVTDLVQKVDWDDQSLFNKYGKWIADDSERYRHDDKIMEALRYQDWDGCNISEEDMKLMAQEDLSIQVRVKAQKRFILIN